MVSGNISFFKHSTILADLGPPPGVTGPFISGYCVKITNLEKYPNYLFFLRIGSQNPNSAPIYKLTKVDNCVSPSLNYRSIAQFAAISKDKINPDDLEDVRGLGTILYNPKLDKAFIKAEPIIKAPDSLPIIYTGSRVEDSFQIQSLDRNGLQLSFVNRSSPVLPSFVLNWIVFPLIGVGILVWIFRRRKKQNGDKQ